MHGRLQEASITAGEETLLKACLVLDGDAFECWYQIRGASSDGDLEYKQVLAEAKAWARGREEGLAQGHAIGFEDCYRTLQRIPQRPAGIPKGVE